MMPLWLKQWWCRHDELDIHQLTLVEHCTCPSCDTTFMVVAICPDCGRKWERRMYANTPEGAKRIEEQMRRAGLCL